MKRFKCKATKTIEIECIIKIDETKINEEWMQEFRDSFYSIDTLKEHAENLAKAMTDEAYTFIEGYGNLKYNDIFYADENEVREEGINIVDLRDSEEYVSEVTEIV